MFVYVCLFVWHLCCLSTYVGDAALLFHELCFGLDCFVCVMRCSVFYGLGRSVIALQDAR